MSPAAHCAGMAPAAVSAGELSNQVVHNGDPVAALHWRVDLAPNETWSSIGLLGFSNLPPMPPPCARSLWWSATKSPPANKLWRRKKGSFSCKARTGISITPPTVGGKSRSPGKPPLAQRHLLSPAQYPPGCPRLFGLRAAGGPQTHARGHRDAKANGYLKVWTTREGESANHPLVHKVHDDGGIWLVICVVGAWHAAGDAALLDEEIPTSMAVRRAGTSTA